MSSDVKIISTDGTEEFILRSENINFNGERSLLTDAVSELEVAGYDPELEIQQKTIEGNINKNVSSSDYPDPNNRNYSSDMHGYAIELEEILTKEAWNINPVNDFWSTFEWKRDPNYTETYDVVVTNVNTDYIAERDVYDFTLEVTIVNGSLN